MATNGMTKLHALLAVYENLKGQASKVRSELQGTFKGKRSLFEGRRKTFTSNDEANTAPVTEDQQEIQSTVKKELDWIQPYLARFYDVAYQIDVANTLATADIETEDGTVLVASVPATTLLQFEKRVQELREFIEAIPTLNPEKSFVPDQEKGDGFYKAREIVKTRTKKTKTALVLYPHSDKHPAQTQLIDEDVPIGTILEQEWSALLTPALKADLVDRAEILYRAVTRARSKANEQEIDVKDKKIGKKLLDFVFEPLAK